VAILTAVSRLICASDDRKTRARLDRWFGTEKSSASGQGSHDPVYLIRKLS
jgi:hypothetical protein